MLCGAVTETETLSVHRVATWPRSDGGGAFFSGIAVLRPLGYNVSGVPPHVPAVPPGTLRPPVMLFSPGLPLRSFATNPPCFARRATFSKTRPVCRAALCYEAACARASWDQGQRYPNNPE